MKVKGFILVVTALVTNIGITNAQQLSTPSVGTPLGTKTTQVDRTQPLEVMPYMESKVMGETELSYSVMSLAKKTYNEQILQQRDVESRMHAHIEEHNRKIRSTPQRDLIKNPYTRKEIEKQIVDAINFKESIKYPVNDKEYYNHIDVDKVNDLSGFPKKIPSFAKQVDIHLKPPKAIEDGRYVQVSFTGKPSELKPYIQDAENHAKVIITKGEAERVSIKPYEDVKTKYRKYMSTILPEEWIEVTNNMFTVAGMAVNPEQTRVIYFLHTAK